MSKRIIGVIASAKENEELTIPEIDELVFEEDGKYYIQIISKVGYELLKYAVLKCKNKDEVNDEIEAFLTNRKSKVIKNGKYKTKKKHNKCEFKEINLADYPSFIYIDDIYVHIQNNLEISEDEKIFGMLTYYGEIYIGDSNYLKNVSEIMVEYPSTVSEYLFRIMAFRYLGLYEEEQKMLNYAIEKITDINVKKEFRRELRDSRRLSYTERKIKNYKPEDK